MHITRIALQDFRNYSSWTIEPDRRLTILTGPNATGKTNAIEAVRLLTAGSSFRGARWEDLVRHGCGFAQAEMRAEGDQRLIEIGVSIEDGGRHAFTVNGKPARSGRGVTGIVPSVVFTPDDLSMVKGPAEGRRREVDELGEQLSAAYGTLRREYDRVVRQRNRLLKEDHIAAAEMESWDEQVVTLGSRLRVHRARLIGRLAEASVPVHGRICPGEGLEIRYVAGPTEARRTVGPDATKEDEADVLRGELESRRSDERARATTLAGPHRDDVEFSVQGKPARSFASQGQQRTIVLSWKLAELAVVEEVTGGEAILLLDDVMSELDSERRRSLTAEVGERVQTIVTTTNTGYFDAAVLAEALVVPIERTTGS